MSLGQGSGRTVTIEWPASLVDLTDDTVVRGGVTPRLRFDRSATSQAKWAAKPQASAIEASTGAWVMGRGRRPGRRLLRWFVRPSAGQNLFYHIIPRRWRPGLFWQNECALNKYYTHLPNYSHSCGTRLRQFPCTLPARLPVLSHGGQAIGCTLGRHLPFDLRPVLLPGTQALTTRRPANALKVCRPSADTQPDLRPLPGRPLSWGSQHWGTSTSVFTPGWCFREVQ
jgi:hypothetical protein